MSWCIKALNNQVNTQHMLAITIIIIIIIIIILLLEMFFVSKIGDNRNSVLQ